MTSTFPTSCTDCPVFQQSLFKDFSTDLIDWLAGKKQAKFLQKKQILFNQHQQVSGIYCHLQGLAKVVQNDAQGNVLFSRLVLPGDTSGHRSLFIDTHYKGTAIVISDSLKACFIDKDDILFLFSNSSSLAKNLLIKISFELNRSESETISLKQKNVRNRLAQLLYELGHKYAETINESQRMINSVITKKDIASLLLVANETVIRLMSEMKSEELITYKGKRIVINDIDKLKEISGIEE